MGDLVYRYHVFLSHNGAQKDWVRRFVQRLREHRLSVFFDEDSILIGEDISSAIEAAIRRSRHIVLVLSPEAISSRWVELEWSISLYRDPNAATRFILPIIRVDCELPLHLARLRYLDATGDDMAKQVRHLLRAIDQSISLEDSPARRMQLRIARPEERFTVGGTIPPSSSVYVERQIDQALRRTLTENAPVVMVVGPRQSGKSSLLARAAEFMQESGRKTIWIDFSGFGAVDQTQFWMGLSLEVERQLGLDEKFAAAGQSKLGAKSAFYRRFERAISSQMNPILLVFDEIDYLRSISVFEEFFSLLRIIANERAVDPAFLRLSILLASVIHPSSYIKSSLQSPFNIGHILLPANFSLSETERLLEQSGVKLRQAEINSLYRFTGGQPFLSHLCAYLLNAKLDLAKIEEMALDPSSPFQMHLESIYAWADAEPQRRVAIARLIKGDTISRDDQMDLFLGGILISDSNTENATFACDMYERFFRSRLG